MHSDAAPVEGLSAIVTRARSLRELIVVGNIVLVSRTTLIAAFKNDNDHEDRSNEDNAASARDDTDFERRQSGARRARIRRSLSKCRLISEVCSTVARVERRDRIQRAANMASLAVACSESEASVAVGAMRRVRRGQAERNLDGLVVNSAAVNMARSAVLTVVHFGGVVVLLQRGDVESAANRACGTTIAVDDMSKAARANMGRDVAVHTNTTACEASLRDIALRSVRVMKAFFPFTNRTTPFASSFVVLATVMLGASTVMLGAATMMLRAAVMLGAATMMLRATVMLGATMVLRSTVMQFATVTRRVSTVMRVAAVMRGVAATVWVTA